MHRFTLIGLVEVLRGSAFAGAVVPAGVYANAEDVAQFLGAEGSERLKCNGQVGAYLQAGVKYGCSAVQICFCHLPGLHVGDVFVAYAGNVHGFLQSLTEVEGFNIFLQSLTARLDLCKSLGINRFRFKISRHCTAEILMREHHGTVHKVAKNSKQLTVIPALEILPGEVVVLGFRGVGGEHITHHILAAGEIAFIFVHPNSPVTGSGNLVALQIQELVGRHVIRQYIIPVSL